MMRFVRLENMVDVEHVALEADNRSELLSMLTAQCWGILHLVPSKGLRTGTSVVYHEGYLVDVCSYRLPQRCALKAAGGEHSGDMLLTHPLLPPCCMGLWDGCNHEVADFHSEVASRLQQSKTKQPGAAMCHDIGGSLLSVLEGPPELGVGSLALEQWQD